MYLIILTFDRESHELNHLKLSNKHAQACTATVNRDKEIDKVAELIENDFELIGSTAIEDKLQEDVGQTIYDLKRAGIQIWVLTGDKVETAINIGFSCRLLNSEMNTFILEKIKPKEVKIEVNNALAQQNVTKKARENAVVVAGETLSSIQKSESLTKEFLDLCEGANVVLACRVSPIQKAQVVQMMRKRNPDKTTLAIGDGANDVNMITAAHIGIGIAGLEGAQAARASDYSIGQFRFLKNLLFVHGREAYRRNAYLIAFMFYKNVFEVMPIWMYGWLSTFSGTPIYATVLYQCYNTVFTAWPIIWFSTFDQEYPKHILLKRPKLYWIGINDVYFNKFVFWRWFFYGMGQSTLIMFVTFYTVAGKSPAHDGQLGGEQACGNFIFIILVIAVNIKVLVSSYQYTGINISLVVFSDAMAILAFWGIANLPFFPEYYGTFYSIFHSSESYFGLFFCTFAFVLWDVGTEATMRELRKWRRDARARAKHIQRVKEAKDPAVIKRQITTFQDRGFAFSQAPGNDILVTDNLTNRMVAAFQQQMQQSEFLHGIPFGAGLPAENANDTMGHSMSVDSQADNLLLKDKAEYGGLFSILKRNAAEAGLDLRTQSSHTQQNETPKPIEEEVEEGSREGSQPVQRNQVRFQSTGSEESEYEKKEGD